jgi:hypothetical protein
MKNEIMKYGQKECECGNDFYFQSIRKEIPCMKCGKMHPNNGEPIPEEPPVEEGDPVGNHN